MTDTHIEDNLIEIDPIREVVSGHSTKFQVVLYEDAPDREILRALSEAGKEWAANLLTGIELQRLVGRILTAVRKREIFKAPEWGTFERFIEVEIEQRFHISRRQAWNALTLAEGIPEDVPEKRLRSIGSVNVLRVAQAVRDAPPQNRARLRESLLTTAEKMSTTDFAQELKGRHLLRTKRTERGPQRVMVSFEVSQETAALWRSIVGERSASVVFSEMVRGARKPVRTAGATRIALRSMREQSA